MDNRNLILDLLTNFQTFDKNEERSRLKIIEFVKTQEKCFDNNFKLGHITGSALVVDTNFKHTLLNYHRKLNKWLQFGGHSDSHFNPIEVAFREAREESGLKSLLFIPEFKNIFGVDIHPIPKYGDMLLHHHYDIRIILTADKKEPFIISSESKDLKWFTLKQAQRINSQPAFLRLLSKAQNISI